MTEDAIQRRIDLLVGQIGAMQENINELNALTGNTDEIKSVEDYGDPNLPRLNYVSKKINDEKSQNGMTRSVKNAYISLYVHDQQIQKLENEIEVLSEFIQYAFMRLGMSKAIPLKTVKEVAREIITDCDARFDADNHAWPLKSLSVMSDLADIP